jgi:glycosyltransferase involved in cell wall biosynthesis
MPDEPAGRILIVSLHFPPSMAVGGVRPANFAKWLARSGWDVRVLTLLRESAELSDPGRSEGLDGIAVSRVRRLPTLLGLYEKFKRARRRQAPAESQTSASGSVRGRTGDGDSRWARWKRYVLSFLLLPDYDRGWIVPAALSAVRLIRQQKSTWLFTTCPPYSTHLVGLLAATVTGVRWVADYRDPWMTTGSKRLYPTSRLSLWVERRLERAVIRRANLVVFNVERLRNAYRDAYETLNPAKFVFIPNAVVGAGAGLRVPQPKYDRFTLIYTGTLYAGRSPEPIFRAAAELVAESPSLETRLRILLVGECSNVDGEPVEDVAERCGLNGVVEVVGPVSHADATVMVARSHLAILLAPGLRYQIPAKFYDYLGTGVRILAVAEEGATSDVVRTTGSGTAFAPDDVRGMKEFIRDALTGSGISETARAAAMERFDPANLTRELVQNLRAEELGTVRAAGA